MGEQTNKESRFSQVILAEELLHKSVPLSQVLNEIAALTVEFDAVDTVQANDFVLCEYTSDDNQPCIQQFVANKADDVQGKFIGMSVGATITTEIDDSIKAIKIIGIKRKTYKQITDEVVASLSIDGVSNIEQYCQRYVAQNLERLRVQTIKQYAPSIVAQLKKQFSGTVDALQIQEFYENQRQELKTYAKGDDEKYTQLLKQNIGKESIEECEKILYEMCRNKYVEITLGKNFATQDNAQMTEAIYEQYLQQASASSGKSLEEIRQATTYVAYCNSFYLNYLYDFINRHYYDKITLAIDKNT